MKTAIVYGSHHHGNTKKVVERLAENYEITLIDAEQTSVTDLSAYDVVGFASGMDFDKFYPQVVDMGQYVTGRQALFVIYTCASPNEWFGDEIKDIAETKGCPFLGKFGCKGYNTYGAWKLIGGMNKKHPNEKDFANAEQFYETVMKQAEAIYEYE